MLNKKAKKRERGAGKFSPERLLQILRGIYPQEVADQKFIELMMEDEDYGKACEKRG